MDAVEQIKNRLSIEEVVQDYVQLQKAGRNFKAKCPWHNDSNPSFVVSPDKGICWCFVCQAGGDIFEFVQKTEGIDFQEALKHLAEKAGVELPEYGEKGKLRKEEKQEIEQVLESSLGFFREQFEKSEEAKNYWTKRNITPEITEKFKIGFAPDSFSATFQHLKKYEFSSTAMTKSGMVVERDEKRGEFFDRFRGRIMIPIHNHMGKIVGFGGRIIKNDPEQAKYLNSPESPLYDKSSILFGLDKAREAIKKTGFVVILEGYMDVIASHQAGVENVVAVSGTALTEEQLLLLKRYTSNLKLCFDQDNAGKEATKRSIELAAEQDFNIEVIVFQNAKDADELIHKGEDLWKQAITSTISSFEFFLREAGLRFSLKNPVEQKQFVSEILTRIFLYPNRVLQQNYVKQLAEKCSINPRILLEDFERMRKQGVGKKTGTAQNGNEIPKELKEKMTSEQYLLAILLNFPNFLPQVQSTLILQVFPETEIKDIYKRLLDAYNATAQNAVNTLTESLDEATNEKLRVWQLFAEGKNELLSDEEWEKECIVLVRQINEQNLKKADEAVVRKLKDPSLSMQEQQTLALKLIEINKLKNAI